MRRPGNRAATARQQPHPPARPRAGAQPREVRRQGGPAVYRHPKNCTAALDNNGRLWYSIGCNRRGRARESVRTSKRANPQGLALFLFAPAGRPVQRPHGACWAITAKGMGCPLLPSSSPHPTACGPTPSRPRGWAPRRFRSLRSLHKGGARVGARRRPLSTPPPPPRPPPKAAAGRAPAVAQSTNLCKAAAGYAGGFASLAKPGGLCRSPRMCSVAAGPRRVVGQRLPSACATHPGTLRPSGWLA